MSALLQKVMTQYKAGRFDTIVGEVGRSVPRRSKADPAVALIVAQAHYKLGNVEEAAHWYHRAGEIPGPNGEAMLQLSASLFKRIKDAENALLVSRQLVARNPRHAEGLALYRSLIRDCLMFDAVEKSDAELLARLKAGDPWALGAERPLDHISWCDDEAITRRLTRIDEARPFTEASRTARRSHPHRFGEKIRIGYLSNDFSSRHATMRLFQGVLLAHDPARFEVTLYCHTPPELVSTDEDMRRHYGRIVPVADMTAEQAAQRMRADGIDILVDLKGHTRAARLDIVNAGGAPIQVAWLGFPGTGTGIDCDYVIGDPVVTPPSVAEHYVEEIVRLPECYQPNDSRLRPLVPPASRASLNLPEDKLVFGSFNGQRKISARTARLFFRVLDAVPDSVLYMMCPEPFARVNFAQHAARAGIAPERMIMTDMVDYPAHLARLQACDLGLDSFPYNGHTTTSDQLWAGLPVPTIRGRSFAARVSESLLTAIGLPELVAEDDDAYVALMVALSADAPRRKALSAHLAEQRFRAPLFDTERYTRHLEKAFEMMVERARAGAPPASFDVPALPPRSERFA